MRHIILALVISTAATAAAHAQDKDADLIEGYRTNDFTAMMPGEIDELSVRELSTDPDAHSLRATYGNDDKSRDAMVMIYLDRGPTPAAVTDQAAAIDRAIASLEGGLQQKNLEGERRDLTSPNNKNMTCVDAEQVPGKLLFSYCSSVVKGRMIAVQTLSSMARKDHAALRTENDDFAGQMIDHVDQAK